MAEETIEKSVLRLPAGVEVPPRLADALRSLANLSAVAAAGGSHT